MPKFFSQTPQAGKPLSMRGIAAGLAKLEKAVAGMQVLNGHVDWTADIPTIVCDAYEQDREPGNYWSSEDTETEDYATSGSVTAANYFISDQGTLGAVEGGGIILSTENDDDLNISLGSGNIVINSNAAYSGTIDLSTASTITVTCGIITGTT